MKRLMTAYAAKYLADHDHHSPPEPTDANLAASLNNCVRPARTHEYPAIREALKEFNHG